MERKGWLSIISRVGFAVSLIISISTAAFGQGRSVLPVKRLDTVTKAADPYISTLSFTNTVSESEIIEVFPPYEKISRLKSKKCEKKRQVSVHVSVPGAGDGMFSTKFRVTQTKDGLTSRRVAIYAKEAVFVRPHFKKIPSDVKLYVYGVQGQPTAQGPVEKDFRNESEGFWGPVVAGEYLFIEMLDKGSSTPADLVIDKISYGVVSPLSADGSSNQPVKDDALSCNVDVNCSTATAANYKNSVAMIYFEEDGAGYACTGSLVADSTTTLRNWFLTANHCISTNTVANTLTAFFGYRTTSCNGTIPNLAAATQVHGSTFITGKSYENGGSDFTLLELWSNPPSGTYYIGWTTNDIAENVIGIHYPQSSYERISEGVDYSGYYSYRDDFWTVLWFSGVTESGSSGSPLMLKSTGQILGQLYAGDIYECKDFFKLDYYGKFSNSYVNGLSTYLDTTATATDNITQTLTAPTTITASRGGTIGPFYVSIKNNTTSSQSITAVSYILDSYGEYEGAPFKATDTLSSGQTKSLTGSLNIPSDTTSGQHTFMIDLYNSADKIIDSDSFVYAVTGGAGIFGNSGLRKTGSSITLYPN
ncbi:MAG: trypsin-like serine protease [Nitrospirae bacterium YQR-1]